MGKFDCTVRPGRIDAGAIAPALGGNGIAPPDGWYRCLCPEHGGEGSNLSIKAGGPAGLIVKCWSCGCLSAVVLQAIDQQLGTEFTKPAATAFAAGRRML